MSKEDGIAELGPVSDAIKRAAAENQVKPKEKLYIISSDGYFGVGPKMTEFQGTFRDLLYHLNDITEEHLDDLGLCKEIPPDVKVEENDPEYYKPLREWPEDSLERLFDHGNGDGQSYRMVWCVDDHKQVI